MEFRKAFNESVHTLYEKTQQQPNTCLAPGPWARTIRRGDGMGKTDEGKRKIRIKRLAIIAEDQEARTAEREENMKMVDRAPENPRLQKQNKKTMKMRTILLNTINLSGNLVITAYEKTIQNQSPRI